MARSGLERQLWLGDDRPLKRPKMLEWLAGQGVSPASALAIELRSLPAWALAKGSPSSGYPLAARTKAARNIPVAGVGLGDFRAKPATVHPANHHPSGSGLRLLACLLSSSCRRPSGVAARD